MAKTELYISAIKKGRQGSGKAESREDISDKRYVRVGVEGAYGVRESEHVRAVSGVYCNRLSETLSVM